MNRKEVVMKRLLVALGAVGLAGSAWACEYMDPSSQAAWKTQKAPQASVAPASNSQPGKALVRAESRSTTKGGTAGGLVAPGEVKTAALKRSEQGAVR
jgi:hypothetical protein